jgi:3-oxoadipate enol-lactonase
VKLLTAITGAVILAAPFSATVDAQSSSGFAKINGENIYYEVDGAGTPVVLIHGWSLNLRMWDQQVPALKNHFMVIRYDRRGFGKSSGGEDVTWDAADLNALLDQLGLKAAHLLGNSQGGRVALQFARDYPDRVLSLTLHGTSSPEGLGLQWTGDDRPRFDEWAKLARENGIDAFRRVWDAHPLMATPKGNDEVRRRLRTLLNDYRGGRFLNPVQPSGPVAPITIEEVRQVRVPTLVIIGESEVPFLQIVARALAYYIAGARLSVIPGGGHMINLIEPARYNAVVERFLEETSTRR